MKTKTILVLSVLFAGWVTIAQPTIPCDNSGEADPEDCPLIEE